MVETGMIVGNLFRERAGQIVAYLTRVLGAQHLALAEEALQDALVKALQQWPHGGVPDNPGGWLFSVARNRALDIIRRERLFASKEGQIVAELGSAAAPPPDAESAWDDALAMIFLCCHPRLSQDARVGLALKTVCGFGVDEIARACLADRATVAQRLVRARRTLRDINARFELPEGPALDERLDSVLEVIYLLFNEGYTAYAGDDLVRQELCEEALRLGRLVAASPATGKPRVSALVALMAFQAARLPARSDENGEMVLLEHQDRTRWDPRLLSLAFHYLQRSAAGREISAYHLQAEIAAEHAAARSDAETNWPRILKLYDELLAAHPSPIVALNRAVALWRVCGARTALDALAPLAAEPALEDYYLLPAVRARLLADLGDHGGALAAYGAALRCTCTAPERRFLARCVAEAAAAAKSMMLTTSAENN